jgi:uncharacterized protein with von Willebrand factor type A (vWA) domain
MRIRGLLVGFVLLGVFASAAVFAADEPAKDVVLVLDNSGSMRKNDPTFLTSQAVTQFINELTGDTRVAMVIFDQVVQFSVPLTQLDAASRATILDSLKQIDYRGKFTDSPAAMERAIDDDDATVLTVDDTEIPMDDDPDRTLMPDDVKDPPAS